MSKALAVTARHGTGKPHVTVIVPPLEELARAQSEHDDVASRLYANAVSYDRRMKTLRFTLPTGVVVAVPASMIADLANATSAELAEVRLSGRGSALEQERLDVHLSVPQLIRDALGLGETQQHRAGRARSPAKAAAARVNGAKGGRPRKVAGTI